MQVCAISARQGKRQSERCWSKTAVHYPIIVLCFHPVDWGPRTVSFKFEGDPYDTGELRLELEYPSRIDLQTRSSRCTG